MPVKSIRYLVLTLLVGYFAPMPALAEEQETAAPAPGYVSLGDAMVLNLATDSKRLTFLQVQANALVNDDDTKAVVESHIPAIRHMLIIGLSEQPAIDLKTPAKRELIRQQITQEVRDLLEKMADNNDVEEILFSTFLIQ